MRSRVKGNGDFSMADTRNRDDNSVHGIEVARLVNGVIDGNYANIEKAQIALERSRRKLLLKRKSNLGSQPARSSDTEPRH
ncbi:hypothetical protein SAMN05519103_09590 [Rhizobiales bacterium GAS113]|nr:hypothetical protein SAMN05519103_09590 [Rhizobiales bacterium GAS113]